MKVADLGLAIIAEVLETSCGSPMYQASEFFAQMDRTNVCDIWGQGTIGMVMLKIITPQGSSGTSWCQKLLDIVDNETDRYAPSSHVVRDLHGP